MWEGSCEDESWYARMVREGRVRLTRNGWSMPEARWQVSVTLDLEEFLLGERDQDR